MGESWRRAGPSQGWSLCLLTGDGDSGSHGRSLSRGRAGTSLLQKDGSWVEGGWSGGFGRTAEDSTAAEERERKAGNWVGIWGLHPQPSQEMVEERV